MKNEKEMSNLPVPTSGGLSIYLTQIKKIPMLDAEKNTCWLRIGEKMVILKRLIN